VVDHKAHCLCMPFVPVVVALRDTKKVARKGLHSESTAQYARDGAKQESLSLAFRWNPRLMKC
jgi:hypothetical protein